MAAGASTGPPPAGWWSTCTREPDGRERNHPTDGISSRALGAAPPQSCAFRDHHADLVDLDATVYGISAQPIDEQREFAARMHLPFPLLNDTELVLAYEPLRLPTFQAAGSTLYRRVTLCVDAGTIRKVFYPVFPPDRNAAEVIEYLRSA